MSMHQAHHDAELLYTANGLHTAKARRKHAEGVVGHEVPPGYRFTAREARAVVADLLAGAGRRADTAVLACGCDSRRDRRCPQHEQTGGRPALRARRAS